MLPVIALVGRPNVGKSTLFNRLTRTRDALVANEPGLTRDRQYGVAQVQGRTCILVDTGGLSHDQDGLFGLMAQQSLRAVDEADLVLFMVDGREGLTATDEALTHELRRAGSKVILTVNKTDAVDPRTAVNEFHRLGLGVPEAISANHGRGIETLLERLLELLPDAGEAPSEEACAGIRVAIVGRPNVGKSTLVNRMLGEERVLVFDLPGTTRDSIYVPFERDDRQYTLIDTAGVRRRGRVHEAIEKFSVIKTLEAVQRANVVVLVVDAREGVTDQDAGLIGHVLEAGRAIVLAVNKWDGLETEQRQRVRGELDRRLPFLNFARVHFVSALHGSGVGKLFDSIHEAHRSATRELPTPQLTRILEGAVRVHQPPAVHGRRVKLRYAHQGGQNPPIIVIHGNQTDAVPDSYKRYLVRTFRKHLGLAGTPVRIEFKTGGNPYQGRKNRLSERQLRKRKRLVKHARKG
jgi:GTP-binding protein